MRVNTPTTAHGIQDIAFQPNLDTSDSNYGLLYIGIGNGGTNNIKIPELCHSNKSFLGTLIRINPLRNIRTVEPYSIPLSNPFYTSRDTEVRKEIYAFGFRNPHRMAWDSWDRMYVADIGEANIEELNIIKSGGDYGWSEQEGDYLVNTKIDKTKILPTETKPNNNFIAPFAQYDHQDGKAISGGYEYTGKIDSLRGKYIFGDIVTGKLMYINIHETLNDDSIYEINLVQNGKLTSMAEIINQKRVHLRNGYDRNTDELFLSTKGDNTIRKVKAAFFKD